MISSAACDDQVGLSRRRACRGRGSTSAAAFLRIANAADDRRGHAVVGRSRSGGASAGSARPSSGRRATSIGPMLSVSVRVGPVVWSDMTRKVARPSPRSWHGKPHILRFNVPRNPGGRAAATQPACGGRARSIERRRYGPSRPAARASAAVWTSAVTTRRSRSMPCTIAAATSSAGPRLDARRDPRRGRAASARSRARSPGVSVSGGYAHATTIPCGLQLGPQRLGQPADRELHRRVRAVAVHAEEADRRRDEQEVTAAARSTIDGTTARIACSVPK